MTNLEISHGIKTPYLVITPHCCYGNIYVSRFNSNHYTIINNQLHRLDDTTPINIEAQYVGIYIV